MPIVPKLEEVATAAAETVTKRVWTSAICEVTSYDSAKQTVDCKFVSKNPLEWGDDLAIEYEELPDLTAVRVVFPRGGGCSITWPIQKGDCVLVVFTALSFFEWAKTGTVGEPGDVRRHSLNGALAIPGVAPDMSPLSTGADPGMTLEAPTIKLGKNAVDAIPSDTKLQIELGKIVTTLGSLTGAASFGTPYVLAPTASLKGKVE